MSQTFTSEEIAVADGDITTHDTDTVGEAISIINAECRWQGVTVDETRTEYTTTEATATATPTEDYQQDESFNIDSSYTGVAATTFPSFPSGYDFLQHSHDVNVYNSTETQKTCTVEYETIDGTLTTETITVDSGQINRFYGDSLNQNRVGEERTAEIVDGDTDELRVEVRIYTDSNNYVWEDTTAETTFPSVPSGETFENHEWEITVTNISDFDTEESYDLSWETPFDSGSAEGTVGVGETVTIESGTTTEDLVGDVVAVTDKRERIELSVTATTISSQEVTETKQTTDPFVTRDVAGSYNGEIVDGDWTAWQSLTGFETGENELYHNISGSEEAVFQFRYEWEYIFPPAIYDLMIPNPNGDSIALVAIADTASDRLEDTSVRVAVDGTVYAIDVADESSEYIASWFPIQTPNGVRYPRVYDSISQS